MKVEGSLSMSFIEAKAVLNDLLWQFNGNKNTSGLCRITEAMGHSFDVQFNSDNLVNINPKNFENKGQLAKYILDIVY